MGESAGDSSGLPLSKEENETGDCTVEAEPGNEATIEKATVMRNDLEGYRNTRASRDCSGRYSLRARAHQPNRLYQVELFFRGRRI